MRCGDRQSCQRWFERELKQAAERLEFMRDMSHTLGPEIRIERERRLDELRGRLNRGIARLEALRRANGDNWRTAAVHADEAFAALTEALLQFDRQASVVQPIAA